MESEVQNPLAPTNGTESIMMALGCKGPPARLPVAWPTGPEPRRAERPASRVVIYSAGGRPVDSRVRSRARGVLPKTRVRPAARARGRCAVELPERCARPPEATRPERRSRHARSAVRASRGRDISGDIFPRPRCANDLEPKLRCENLLGQEGGHEPLADWQVRVEGRRNPHLGRRRDLAFPTMAQDFGGETSRSER